MRYHLLYLLLLLTSFGLFSCTTFYVPPPAESITFKESKEVQIAFYHAESGMTVRSAFSFDLPSILRTDSSFSDTHKIEASDTVKQTSEEFWGLFASFELYDHLRNSNDSSDIRDQTEYSASIGIFGSLGSWNIGSSVGLALGEIEATYHRSKLLDTTTFPFPSFTPHQVIGTYLRPWIEAHGGIILDLSPVPCVVETGLLVRTGLPFFTAHTTTDRELDTIGLQIELGAYARLMLLDLIAFEWIGGGGYGSDWNYEYSTLGLRLILGR